MSSSVKKKLSGAQNRKRKAEEEKKNEIEMKKNKKIRDYLLTSSASTAVNVPGQTAESSETDNIESKNDINDVDHTVTCQHSQASAPLTSNDESNQDLTPEIFEKAVQHREEVIDFVNNVEEDSRNSSTKDSDVADPASWPEIRNISIIDRLVLVGPTQIRLELYPQDKNGRRFSSAYFYRVLSNGERITRRWLMYSVSENRLFCFCCMCFDPNAKSCLSNTGFDDWSHLTETLKSHERGVNHEKSYQT